MICDYWFYKTPTCDHEVIFYNFMLWQNDYFILFFSFLLVERVQILPKNDDTQIIMGPGRATQILVLFTCVIREMQKKRGLFLGLT